MIYDYDLLVIGAGPGGLAASERAAKYGAKVGIIEENLVGGACVIRGCIPEKLMSFAAEFSEDSQDAAGYGWNKAPCTFNWQQFLDAKNEEIHRLSQVHTQALAESKVELIKGHATFLDAHTLQVSGKHTSSDKILITVGAKPVKPNIPGIEYTITSNELFNLPQQPKHIVVVGGNYIAVKLAGIMKNLGSQVTLIVEEEHILSKFDQDIYTAIEEGISKRGIQIINNTTIKQIEKISQDSLSLTLSRSNTDKITADKVLCVLDRIPNINNLGLEKAGIEVKEGAICVDNYNRTTKANIFAVGDCINNWQFTPVAIAQGRAFADTEFGNNPHCINCKYVPITISSYPESATVGLSEAQAEEKFGDIRCYRSQFRPLLHSLTKRDEHTLIKLVVDNNTEKVLGAHMVGENAIEIIQCISLALRLGVTKKDFDETIGIHPSVAEEFFTLK